MLRGPSGTAGQTAMAAAEIRNLSDRFPPFAPDCRRYSPGSLRFSVSRRRLGWACPPAAFQLPQQFIESLTARAPALSAALGPARPRARCSLYVPTAPPARFAAAPFCGCREVCLLCPN